MNRVLYLAMSPDGETIVTGAGDETLRFWNVFSKREKNEKRVDCPICAFFPPMMANLDGPLTTQRSQFMGTHGNT